ncbi:MAG: hypothetical protein EOO86_12005 [Pedobacter sp.]|nr:MAG: hypothetical protein EOO86_12005 [Pedobacter sp.]
MQLSIPATPAHQVKSNLKVWISDHENFLEGLRKRDEVAFRELYQKYAAALYGNIRRKVQDDSKSAYILECAFLEIWESIASYDDTKARLFTWMNQICIRMTNSLIETDD